MPRNISIHYNIKVYNYILFKLYIYIYIHGKLPRTKTRRDRRNVSWISNDSYTYLDIKKRNSH